MHKSEWMCRYHDKRVQNIPTNDTINVPLQFHVSDKLKKKDEGWKRGREE